MADNDTLISSSPSTPSTEPPPLPSSVTGAATITDLVATLPPAQQAIYKAMLGAQRTQSAQSQAAAGAAAAGKLRENQLYKDFLSSPRPEVRQPQYRQMPSAPKAEYRSPLQAVGNPLAGLALVAGFFTRQAGTSALKLAAAAMKAQREGDDLAYKNAHQAFADSLEETIRNNDQERTAYLDSWNNRKMTMQERLADLEMKATMFRNEALAASARSGNVNEAQMQLTALAQSADLLKALQPVGAGAKPDEKIWQEGDAWARRTAAAEGKENDPRRVAELRKQYIDEATPGKGKGSGRGLSLEDRIKLEEAKADLAAGRDRAKAADRIAELEAKERLAETLAERRGEIAKQLQDARLTAQREGKQLEFERKAELIAEENRKKAQAALDRLNVKMNGDKERAIAKDAKLQGKLGDTLKDTAQAVKEMQEAVSTFRDSYADYGLESLAQLNQWLGARSKGGSSEALWWANKEFMLTMPLRHQLFGATLTGGEKESWKATDITPAMNPDQIRMWFDSRLKIMRSKLADQINTLRSKGVSDENIRIVVGDDLMSGLSSGEDDAYKRYGLTPRTP